MPAELLVLGLELGDGALLRRWVGEGRLPTLAPLFARGRWRWLATPAELLHVAAWPSLYTGVGPGGHGVYFTFQPAPGIQGWQRFAEGLYGRPSFWTLLARTGRRVLVFDAPYSHPEPGFVGDAVFDWGTWARYLGTTTRPPELASWLSRHGGRYPLPWEAHSLGLAPLPPEEVERQLVRAVGAKAEVVARALARDRYHLAFAVFTETHVAAHYLFDPASGHARMRRLAEALDRALAPVLAAAGEQATVVLVSADAVKPNHAGWHLLPEVLVRLGHFASAEFTQVADREGAVDARPGRDPVRAMRDLLPKNVRKRLAGLLPRRLRDRLARRVDLATVDWHRTRAFPLPTDLEGLIRINLRGREPLGVVEPGAEYEALLDRLEAEFAALRLADGTPAVRRVLRADREFPGPRRDRLPDLVVLWSDAAPISSLQAPTIGEVAGPSPDPRPGTHGGPGFALVVSPRSSGPQAAAGDVRDLAPGILAAFGISPPSHMEGRVWPEFVGAP